MSQKHAYEAGMRVVYDPQSRKVIVNFRGRVQVLPDFYDGEAEAVAAGELHCRHLGWRPEEYRGRQGNLHSAWR